MNEQPEALRLADWLGDQYDKTGNCEAAADTLHALYVENELLRNIARLYDQLRVVIDRGRESITHDVAVEAVRLLHAENDLLRQQHLEAHRNSSTIFAALVEISLLTHLGGEVADYGDVVDAVRRLKEENERLHQINQSHEMKLSVRGDEIQIEDLRLAHAELRERNAELLEALKRAHTWLQGSEPGRAQYLGEVIARAEGDARAKEQRDGVNGPVVRCGGQQLARRKA